MQSSIFPELYPVKKPIFLASLDKLVQLPTKPLIISSDGKGNKPVKTNLLSRSSLSRRASSKYYTNLILKPLMYYAKEIGSPLLNHYQKAYHCCDTFTQQGKKGTSKYCNSRVCHTCNRIRTRTQIDKYEPTMAKSMLEGSRMSFATLTIPNVKDISLKDTIRLMKKQLSLIQRVITERRGITAKGIAKIEVTYNFKREDYHPHFHIISDSFEYNQMIIEEWLKRFPTATRDCQHNRDATLKQGLKELFKYTTKIIDTDSRSNKKKKDKTIAHVNLKALDVIMNALHKQRTITAFGMKQISEDVDSLVSQEYYDLPPTPYKKLTTTKLFDNNTSSYYEVMSYEYYPTIEWVWKDNDWYSTGYCDGIPLSNYIPKSEDKFSFHFHYK